MLRKKQIALALSMAWGLVPSVSLAQQTSNSKIVNIQLEEITISANRTERRVDKGTNTVTLTSAVTIEQEGARDIKDVFRNEIDVSVRAAPTRFTAAGSATGRAGNEGINIRGLEGNQVLMVVDGIRVPNSFSFGSFATGRGDFLEVDGVKSMEVLRGPTSTRFGSDGLAGAVNFHTLEAADLLKEPEQTFGGFVRSSYASVDRSWANTIGMAMQNGAWQGLLLGSYRQGHALENRGRNDAQNSTRTSPNPIDTHSHYLLAKATLTIDSSQQLGVSLEAQKRQQNTEVYSARAVPPLTSTSTLDLDTLDHVKRERLSLEHHYNNFNAVAIQHAESQVYWQDATVHQFATEDRNTATDRTRDNRYRTKVVGLSTVLESNLTEWFDQRLSYGIDWSHAEIAGVRDGTVPPYGEKFPTKPFPNTRYILMGAFVQSEIESGSLNVIPGLRFDHYQLAPSASGYVSANLATLSGQAVTPRLGAVWALASSFAPYVQIAQGFRAPAPDQVNNGFTNLASGYTSIGNANLKAEHASSIEIGFRGRLVGLQYSAAAFDNRYKDFISQQIVSGIGTPSNPTVFQFVNFANAHIRGLEARAEWQLDSSWVANAGIAYSKGDSEIKTASTPLDTINPLKLVLGLRYDAAFWGSRVNFQYNQGKQPARIAKTSSAQFAPADYTVLDLGIYWKPTRNISLNANLNNVFNKKYWRWSDVRGLADSSAEKDAYTAPGRNAQVSLRYDF